MPPLALALLIPVLKLDWNINNPKRWIVEEDFSLHSLGIDETIEKGFDSDLGSFPWWIKWLYDENGEGTPAFVTHDWLYKNLHLLKITRHEADIWLLIFLLIYGVKPYRAIIFYIGVRVGGWKHVK